jgi:hypothetical protein
MAQRKRKLIGPEDLSPKALAYIAEWSTLNQPPLSSGQIVGAEKYARIIDTVATQIVVQEDTAETTVYFSRLGGGTLGTQGGVRLLILGTYLNSSGLASTTTLKFKLGTTIWEAAVSMSSQANRAPLIMDFYLTGAGATNAQTMHGVVYIADRTTAPTEGLGPLSVAGTSHPVYASASVDSTTNRDLIVSIQHQRNNANTSYHRNHAVLSKYGH